MTRESSFCRGTDDGRSPVGLADRRVARCAALGRSRVPRGARGRRPLPHLTPAVGPLLACRRSLGRAGSPAGRWSRPALLVAALPTMITFVLEIAGIASFSNMARAIAALPLGAAAGWLFVRMLLDSTRPA